MRFPYYIFNPNNSANLKWRISEWRRYRIAFRNIPLIPEKPKANFSYVTLTCRKDLMMSQVSLETLARHTRALPDLVIAYDESLTESEVKEFFSFWPGKIYCLDRASTAAFHDERGWPLLADFCRKHIFGFKFAACLRIAHKNRVLYADSDILWFRDVVQLMNCYSKKAIYAAQDYTNSYNLRLLSKLPNALQEEMSYPPFINAGFAIFNRFISEIDNYQELLLYALTEDKIHLFSEQTLVAILAKTVGDTIQKQDVYVDKDRLTYWIESFHNQPWSARHYVGPIRHQLWIDANAALNC
ncbi:MULTISPECIES: hypothetical protein [Moorena]|uniref:Nucleotide-diphospho-sugar transferase domain-containing protein n=2 Tax=Moorena TaxID=1155738 RepID=F4XY81_9CYAN|nr:MULTISPECIES: hypothetical protein [Moorena]EGJ30478.1 hypothetical protein LYNGBM3L_50370 [Moorena producens 3L]NER88581.1 hypothetical protein [Moorena sp. SIO3A2]OLT68629.1 hypothetical protein BI334_29710 [Moorena producens 3L]